MENQTAKHFVLQLGSLITLYLSVSFLLVLVFSIINLLYPDAAQGYYEIESSSYSARLGMAMLVVFFPTYTYLTRTVNELRRKESETAYHGITKWLIYLSLLIGGGVLLGDFVAVILTYLNGELTTRFILKAAFLLIVVGVAFYYYIQDARGYWVKKEQSSIIFGGAMAVTVIASIIVGFLNIESPAVVREMKLDSTQVNDLQEMQWRVQDFITISSSTLPKTISEVYGEFEAPRAPEGREAYTYEVTETGFKLCATFAHETIDQHNNFPMASIDKEFGDNTITIRNPDNWSHKEGRYCFDRIVK